MTDTHDSFTPSTPCSERTRGSDASSSVPRSGRPWGGPARRLRGAVAAALIASFGLGLGGCTEVEAAPGDDAVMQRLAQLEAKEEIRTTMMRFSEVVDTADVDGLEALTVSVHEDFELDAIDFDGKQLHFDGIDGLLEGYGPIMVAAQANLMPSAIDVDVDGDFAQASFKFINSVEPPPQLQLPVDVKVLLFATNTATFVQEDGGWKLLSLELVHSLGYPGSLQPAGAAGS